MAARERDVQQRIMLHLGQRPYLRLWRQNVGVAVPIGIVKRALSMLEAGRVNDAKQALARARVVRFGVPGAADLSGAFACGVRLELEVKRPGGKQSEEQRAYQGVMDRLGVAYGVADSEEAADAFVDKHVQGCTVCSRRTAWAQQ